MMPFRVLALAAATLLLCRSPAAALDLFATHEVTVQFATADGKAMAGAEVKVFAPGDPKTVVKTGRTGKDGKFEFTADRDGLWTAEARVAGEVERATVRVGAVGDPGGGPSPYLLLGALVVLLVLAVGYRVLRVRARKRG
jgi:hypothetical protein